VRSPRLRSDARRPAGATAVTEAAAAFPGQRVPVPRTAVRNTGPIRRARHERAAARISGATGNPVTSNPGRSWLVVLDGAVGADLPAIAEQLTAAGAEPVPLGGRLGRAGPADEGGPQARPLPPEGGARRRARRVRGR